MSFLSTSSKRFRQEEKVTTSSNEGYSRHSAWIHPAFASQTQSASQNQFPPRSRKGKWSEEEESYARKLIEAFNNGYLKVSSVTTLRRFLAERLGR